MADRPLIRESLAFYNAFGLINYHQTSWGTLRKIITLLVLIVGYLDILAATKAYWNDEDHMERIFITLSLGQVLIKGILIACLNKPIIAALHKFEHFLPMGRYGLSQEQINSNIFLKTQLFFKSFRITFAVIIFSYFLRPIFEDKLPYSSYVFSGNTYSSLLFKIGWISEFVLIIFVTPAQIGFDLFYLSMITNLICEFKMVKAGFAQIPIQKKRGGEENTMKVLVKLIEHHNLVLDCTKALRGIYYIPFLCIFLTAMLSIGTCLVVIIVLGTENIPMSVTYAVVSCFFTVQLFSYCAPGTILISESTEVCDVVFSTNWWIKTQPELRRAYVMILQRANKAETLSAGGMVNVTLESFAKILKNTLSFFTFVQATYKH